ncbi:MAG: DEAD/DEAH box helicase [Acidimicrobiales bacterium]|nr:DEAD/DEAH box helicase [Acidimicrobiales bacterium]
MQDSFRDLGLSGALCAELERSGFDQPFPIQLQSIEKILEGRDILGRAPTGSGKTFAFGLPLLEIKTKPSRRRPVSLVLTPTRELASQIVGALEPFAKVKNKRLAAIYGGVSYLPQRKKLDMGVDIVVACPGRLLDLIEQGSIYLDGVETLVIDEADRMADMGFMPDVKRIVDLTTPGRQIVLFSATLDSDVAKLTKRYQHEPFTVEVEASDEEISNVRHEFWAVKRDKKMQYMAGAIASFDSAIIFSRTRHGAESIMTGLRKYGIRAESIHGGKSQAQRSRALEKFIDKKVSALVATDVCARGIDVENVSGVVHYDPPEDSKDYVHRSGRTGRAGQSGVVISLVGDDQVRKVKKLVQPLGIEFSFTKPDFKDGMPEMSAYEPRQDYDREPQNRGRSRRPQPRGRSYARSSSR